MSERIRRPEIERSEPRRGLVDLVRETSGATTAGDPGDVVSRSIGVGYRIVEEYLQQSRNAAATMSPGAGGADAANSVAALTSRMARATADLFDIWFQVLSATSAVRPPAEPAPAAEGSGNGASGRPTQREPVRTGIEVDVVSSRPARVAVDLRPGAGRGPLVAHALRSNDESLPRITEVSVEGASDAAPVVVRLRVPADQPAGVYSGMLIDEASSLPVGTVSVIVSDDPRPA